MSGVRRNKKIIECVPNFSEGRNLDVINAIADAIRKTPGVTLLDVDSGYSTNRTVYTFVGSPDGVVEAALASAKVAYGLIDMRKHSGEHKRIGALDVCPFIPVQGVEMEEAVYCARSFASKLASSLNVPVYLYGYAAHEEYRRSVAQIRSGEYEGLKEKLLDPDWKPDYGPTSFVPTFGAAIIGARKFLIAYNVNLIGTKEQAHRIALNIREQGRSENEPGRLKSVQAVGWWIKESNLAQVSINILDYNVTGIHTVYEEVEKDAKKLKLPLIGSQIVGMIPMSALTDAANYFIKKESLFILDEDQMIKLVIQRLGLNSLSFFDPNERIIEYKISSLMKDSTDEDNLLINMKVTDFIQEVGSRTTAPGGGSVAATVASLGCALASMVGKMSFGRKQFDSIDDEMRTLIPIFHHSISELTTLIDEDTFAYQQYVEAMKLPSSSEEEIAIKKVAIKIGIKQAINVPLNLARKINQLWIPAKSLAELINISSFSDLEVGVSCLELGTKAAMFNVRTNLHELESKDYADDDADYKNQVWNEINKLMMESSESCAQILGILNRRKGK